MKRVWNFLNTTLGVGLLVALLLVLVALFGGRNVVGPAGQPLATAVVEATPTSAPEPPFSVEDIQIARRYPLEVEGEVLEDNPWGEYYAPLFSPDGTMMLFRKRVIGGAELWRTDAQGKRAQRLLEKVWGYAWSPDGKWIAYTQSIPESGASLWVMKADGTERRKVAEPLRTGQVQWSREGQLVYMASDSSIVSVGQDGTQVRQLVPSLIPSVDQFALSPGGDRLVLTSGPEVWLVNLEKPEELKKITPYYGAFSGIRGGLAWSPDSSKVAYASDYKIYLVDRNGSNTTEVKTAWYPSHLAWSPDGQVLAFIGQTEQRGFSLEIYLTDAEGKEVKQLTDDREGNVAGGSKYSLVWSPDGSKLIYGTSQLPGQKVQVIEITTKKQSEGELKGVPIGESEGQTSRPFVLSASDSRTPALSDCPYQEENEGTIWVYRKWYCPPEIPPEQCTQQIPFEIGIYEEDPTWSNYLGGVLEGEIAGDPETALANWQDETAKAQAVAARTVAIFWCPQPTSVVTDVNGITHYGLDDRRYQVYWPGWSAARAEDYRGFVADTEGEYLTYSGNLVSALQYRNYSGRMTEDVDPNPPHRSIYDPVAAVDETPAPGLGQHSANHWAMGLHNERLGEPVDVPNVQWSEYRQILVHYYTGVHIEEHEGPILTPDRRWNMLEHDVPTTMTAGQQYPLTVVIQNTGVDPWAAGDFYLGHRWCDAGGASCGDWTTVPLDAASWPVNPGDLAAAELTVQTPTSPGSYVLRFDLSGPGQNNWFGEQSPHPWFVQDVPLEVSALTPGVKELTIVSHSRWYEPATRRFAAVQEAGPTPGSPYALPAATPIWGQEHLDGTTTNLTERFSIPEQATELNGTVKFLVDKGIVTLKLNATPIAQYDAYYQPTPQAYPLTGLLPGVNVFQADLYNRGTPDWFEARAEIGYLIGVTPTPTSTPTETPIPTSTPTPMPTPTITPTPTPRPTSEPPCGVEAALSDAPATERESTVFGSPFDHGYNYSPYRPTLAYQYLGHGGEREKAWTVMIQNVRTLSLPLIQAFPVLVLALPGLFCAWRRFSRSIYALTVGWLLAVYLPAMQFTWLPRLLQQYPDASLHHLLLDRYFLPGLFPLVVLAVARLHNAPKKWSPALAVVHGLGGIWLYLRALPMG